MDARGVQRARSEPGQVVTLVKAYLAGKDRVAASNVVSGVDESERVFLNMGAIAPPYDPETLCALLENSNSLRQNIDAYVTNIDAFGHRFEPVIDIDASDADQQIANAIQIERQRAQERPTGRDASRAQDLATSPTPEEVAARKREVAELMRHERSRLESFFEYCCVDSSFVTLRRRTRLDLELLGNGYWEVLRDGGGQIVQFVYVPGFTVRLLPLDPELVEIDHKVKLSDLAFETMKVRHRFRRYVQVFETQTVYFKEFGDPRVVSRRTGRVLASADELMAADPSDGPATEILHFRVHNPRSAYGVPRWIGNLLAVLGSRQAEEVNFLYFENKSVPPLALLVSGGRLSAQSIPRIEDFIENHIKGKRNFHKVLILEAEPAGSGSIEHSGRLKIELRPLTSAQHSDALFQSYDERNIDKVGQSFRLPRMLRGDIRDFNRSCYSEDTETLTESGWRRVDEIGDGERIAAYDQVTDSIVYVVPASKHVHQVEEELVHFENQQVDVLVTSDHRMLVRPNGEAKGPWAVRAAGEVNGARFDFRVAPERHTWFGKELDRFELPKDPGCKIERGHTHASLDVDAWLEFVGYFVSDGGLRVADHPTAPYYVYLDQTKPETLARMRVCLDRLGWTHSVQTPPSGCTRLLISNRCLRAWLAENCGIDTYERKLPPEYLHLEERQLAILFNALMRGDGHVEEDGARNGGYTTSSRALAGQVQQLCLHLGLRSRLHERTSGAGRPFHEIFICNRQTAALQRADVRRIPFKGRVYCFSVPEYRFFVTRRKGKVAIQGNTADAALHFAESQVFEPERQEFDFIINRKILADMGIRFWRFVSKSPVNRDPATMAEIIRNLMNANVLTPEEARQLAGEVFNREFKKISAPWVKQPVPLTLAGVPIGPEEQSPLVGPEVASGQALPQSLVPPGTGKRGRRGRGPDLAAEASRLLQLRDVLREAEARAGRREFRAARQQELETEVVHVPAAELASWFEPEAQP